MNTFIRYSLSILFSVFIIAPFFPQEINSRKILNVTLDTSEPSDLQINNGKLIWKDKDLNSGTFNLKFYSGGEIIKLDSNLANFSSSIDGDFIGWSTSSGEIKIYNIKTWSTATIGFSYNPDGSQKISISNDQIAFPSPSGSGSKIIVKNLLTDEDTSFSAGVWDLEPSLNQGQLVWVQKFLADTNFTNIYFFDGVKTKNLTANEIASNYSPVLKDGQIVWLQYINNIYKVILFDGDSLTTLAEAGEGSYISGYDLSNGITVASVTDSASNATEIKIYNSETKSYTILNDTAKIHGLHIDNGIICWSSGSGATTNLVIYNLNTAQKEEWGLANNPVIDDEQVAWTLGDAVSLLIPENWEQISSGNENGWAQTRFKNNNGEKIIWGNFDNSTNARLFFNDGSTTTQLTDSLVYKDFVMMNGGYAIWRHDFTSLYLYDEINPPRALFDSLQCENMYISGNMIGFHGFRLDAGNNINQAWIYKIDGDTLIQLTNDTSDSITNTFTLIDGNNVCWYRDSSDNSMLILYDGASKRRITDAPVNNQFAFFNGKIVWSESVNGIFQIFLYDTASRQKKQISNSLTDAVKPTTDGYKITWFESGTNSEQTSLWYYDIQTDKGYKVAHFSPSNIRWYWLSNGKIAWANSEVFVYDGNVISQLTNSGPFNPNSDAYVDNDVVVWNKNNPDPNIFHFGQIYRSKLHPHISFSADKISGYIPFNVSFTNHSFQGVESYHWDFGDGGTSDEKNPVHTYQTAGVYSVTLTADGVHGSNTEKKINLIRTDVAVTVQDKQENIPSEFILYQNYPNPFNPATTIKFSIPSLRSISLNNEEKSEKGLVTLKVYDILGREITTLVNEAKPPGFYEIKYDASKLSSGVYFCRLSYSHLTKGIKILLLR